MPSGRGPRRKWIKGVGYSYDGINPTGCQCNTSSGGCKCGKLRMDQIRERNRIAERRNASVQKDDHGNTS